MSIVEKNEFQNRVFLFSNFPGAAILNNRDVTLWLRAFHLKKLSVWISRNSQLRMEQHFPECPECPEKKSSSLQYYKTFWQGCIRSQDVFHIPNRATIAVDVIQESSTRLSTRYRACREYSIGTQDMSPKANMKPNPSSRMSHVVNMEDWNNNIKLLWNLKIKNGSCELKVIQQFLIWVLADSLNTVNKNHPYGCLTAFVLIVSAHLYYAGKFTSQAMDSAILDVQWPLFFFWWINFLYDFLHLAKKWRKWLYKSEA